MMKRSLAAALVVLGCAALTPSGAGAEAESGYASVNGLEMYYEVHGSGPPLVLLHGGLMTIESFGALVPALAETRRVIAVEQQAHGRTADIDRPLSYAQMAADVAAVMAELGIANADIYGYSMGGGAALQLAIAHPELVRKLVLVAASYSADGMYPEVTEGIAELKPEDFVGSPWHEAYLRVAPRPEDWPKALARVQELTEGFDGWTPEQVASIAAPALVIVADSDVIRPEHAVELFRLLGGGVPGDLGGLPRSQLAIVPGTTHVTLLDHVEWIVPMVEAFLAAPMPDAE